MHDIGKNIVKVVLQCNHFEVIDAGVMVHADVILDQAQKLNVDIVGLSGLITPSLEQMALIATEMERRGMTMPLLVGGATTSLVHTAVKIAPNYSGPVIQARDASQGTSAAIHLLNPLKRKEFIDEIQDQQARLRQSYQQKRSGRSVVTLDHAREHGFKSDWSQEKPLLPKFFGVRSIEDQSLAELVSFIDWTPFFQVWDLNGRFPGILSHATMCEEARSLFDDALKFLEQIIATKVLRAKGVFGFFAANALDSDEIEIYVDDPETKARRTVAVLAMLRQQGVRPEDHPYLCLSDFIAPKSSGLPDAIGFFAVTAGLGLDEAAERLERDDDDYGVIMIKALADRLAEAFAERLHQQVRMEHWGYAPQECLTNEELIREKYSGIRPAPGYPSCPDHVQKQVLFNLLDVEKNADISLTESFAMHPGPSVSGFYFAHPEAKYFRADGLGRDQVTDYARRLNISVEEVELRLAAFLSYAPGS